MADLALLGVRAHEDLVLPAAGQPRAVAVVALDGAALPVVAAVVRREQGVVRQVDPCVVDAAARVHRQVGIAEARVFGRNRGEAGAVEVVALPGPPVVGRDPDVHLVAVVRDEVERVDDPVAVQVRRPLVRGVDQRVVLRVGDHARLPAREVTVHEHRLGEAHGSGERRRRPERAQERDRRHGERAPRNRPTPTRRSVQAEGIMRIQCGLRAAPRSG